MKSFLTLATLVLSLVNGFSATNTNVMVISPRELTNKFRVMLNSRQFDTNVVPFTITNFAGIVGGFEVTQFATNNGIVSIVPGVQLTNAGFSGSIFVSHLSAGTNVVTYNWGPGAGSSPTAGPDGSTILNGDTAYTIDVTAGAGPTVGGNVVTNIFGTAYGRPPHVTFSAAHSNSVYIPLYVSSTSITSVTFTVAGSTVLTNGVRYKWAVHVIE